MKFRLPLKVKLSLLITGLVVLAVLLVSAFLLRKQAQTLTDAVTKRGLTIASNLAKNELRNRSRNPLVLFQTIRKNWQDEDRPLQFEDAHTRPDDLYRKRHLRELVEQSVEQLPEHHRTVFVLRELEGKSYEEIAEITDCNLGTVKSRLNRARNSFAEIIGPSLD